MISITSMTAEIPRSGPAGVNVPFLGGEGAGHRTSGKGIDQYPVDPCGLPGGGTAMRQCVIDLLDEPHEIAGGGGRHVGQVSNGAEQSDLHRTQKCDRHGDECVRGGCR